MGLKTVCLSVTAAIFVLFVFISIISDDIQGIEVKSEDGGAGKEGREDEKGKSKIRKRESSFMDEYGNEEVHVGGKRFKLYEKKHLNYKKAKAYCKKHEGKLAEAMNLEEMRRLQVLITRAKSISNDMWVGADKKEWKKHSLKMQRRPNFGPDPMLFGGGPTEMCPALGVSTRSLLPVTCTLELPFICEFDSNPKPKTPPPKKVPPPKKASPPKRPTPLKANAAARGGGKVIPAAKPLKANSGPSKANKIKSAFKENERIVTGKRSSKRRVEMRKKREILLSPSHEHSPPAATPRETTTTSQTAGPLSSDAYDIIELGVTTVPITENPASAAAEHKIGFSPHIEHVAASPPGSSGQTTPVFDDLFELEKVDLDAELESNDVADMSGDDDVAEMKGNVKVKGTTTVHPDQILVNLMDEQTMNLTAIELEAMQMETRNESQPSHTLQQLEPQDRSKLVEFVQGNELPLTVPSAETLLDPLRNSTEDEVDVVDLQGNSTESDDALEMYLNSSSDPIPATVTNQRLLSPMETTTEIFSNHQDEDLKRTNRKAVVVAVAVPTQAHTSSDTTWETMKISTEEVRQVPTSSSSPPTEQTSMLSPTVPAKQAQLVAGTPFNINMMMSGSNHTDNSSFSDVAPEDSSLILEEGYLVTEMDVTNNGTDA